MKTKEPSSCVEEAEKLLERFEQDPAHTRHVALLAGLFFSETQGLHHLGEEERHFLHVAALLHDIGWAKSPKGVKHHKISAEMIRQYHWKTLKDEEVRTVAAIARYHRKALPKAKHLEYSELSPAQRKIVSSLAALLRMADALDRTHRQVVRSLEVKSSPGKKMRVIPRTEASLYHEIRAFDDKKDLFESFFEQEIEVEMKK